MTTLTVRCVLGHEHEIKDDDGKIRLQGYMRCQEPDCKRNAWTVNIRNYDDGQPYTEDDMKHLDDPSEICDKCGQAINQDVGSMGTLKGKRNT